MAGTETTISYWALTGMIRLMVVPAMIQSTAVLITTVLMGESGLTKLSVEMAETPSTVVPAMTLFKVIADLLKV